MLLSLRFDRVEGVGDLTAPEEHRLCELNAQLAFNAVIN